MRRRLQRGLRVTFIGLTANAVLAAGKMTAGILGHSHALVADATESLADLFSSLIVWRGLVLAASPADEDHPYGHGKAEPLAAAIVSTILLLAATWIAVGAIQGIVQPSVAPAPYTLAVLLVAVAVKEALFRFVLREADSLGSPAVRSDAWHHRSDAITSIAAALGITFALVGGQSFAAADKIAAIVAAGIIAWNGWRLLRPALDELMDIAPDPAMLREICAVASAVAGVERIEKCVARKTGYQYLVDMHVEVDPQMPVFQAHTIAHAVKDQVRNQIPEVQDVLVHIEPRLADRPALRAGGTGESPNRKAPTAGA